MSTTEKKFYRFRSNVNLNSAFFEKGHVYPLPESVASQIRPEALQEVSVEDVEATQRRIEDEQKRLDELNRAGQRRPLVIEDDSMAEAAMNPLVGRPVIKYPHAQDLNQNTVSADEAGEVQVVEGDSETPAPKKGKDFRNTIAKK